MKKYDLALYHNKVKIATIENITLDDIAKFLKSHMRGTEYTWDIMERKQWM